MPGQGTHTSIHIGQDMETQVLSTRDGLADAGGLAYERCDIVLPPPRH